MSLANLGWASPNHLYNIGAQILVHLGNPLAIKREVFNRLTHGTVWLFSSVGLVMSFSHLGGFIFPPLGNSLANIDSGLPFILWSALVVLSLLGFRFVRRYPKLAKDEVDGNQ